MLLSILREYGELVGFLRKGFCGCEGCDFEGSVAQEVCLGFEGYI